MSIVASFIAKASPIKYCHEDKEIEETRELIVLEESLAYGQQLRQIVRIRIYRGRSRGASRIYANAWVSLPSKEQYGHGSGMAGGSGYCRKATAAAEALEKAGLKFTKDISGGMSTIDNALEEFAKFAGYTVYIVATA